MAGLCTKSLRFPVKIRYARAEPFFAPGGVGGGGCVGPGGVRPAAGTGDRFLFPGIGGGAMFGGVRGTLGELPPPETVGDVAAAGDPVRGVDRPSLVWIGAGLVCTTDWRRGFSCFNP